MTSHDQFRAGVIEALIRDIAALTGGVFETWAYGLMQFLEPNVRWDNRGTTTSGAPVGHTVDSSGDHGRVVGQFSSAKNYFSDSKPVDDLKSTVVKHPHVEVIWLLAAVQAAPSERTTTDTATSAWNAAHSGIRVHTLDGRQIATYIADNLDSDELVLALQDKLPSLARIADENAFSQSLPQQGPYVPRPDLEASVRGMLASQNHVVLAGISGAGKSDLAATFARSFSASTRIWLDASAIKRPEDLRSVMWGRRGLQHNIQHVLRKQRCIAVLDNLPSPWSVESLRAVAGESKVIVTTQIGGQRDDVVVVGNADQTSARQILELESSSTCPDHVFGHVWNVTDGHPLLLRMLGKLAVENGGDWDMVKLCCETIVSHGEDGQNEKVCRRILKQHLPAVQDELAYFVWCESPLIDSALLSACTSPLAAANLRKRHLLTRTTNRTVRLHDIVFASARIEVEVSESVARRYRERLETFVRNEMSGSTLVLERSARRHDALLLRELRFQRSSELLYAAARARVDVAALDAFGDLLSEASAVGNSLEPEVAARAIIEAIEATYSLVLEHEGRKEAQDRLRALMGAFDTLESVLSALGRDALCADVRHHRAKMLTRLDQWEEAEAQFTRLLQENPGLHHAKLQLVRVLARVRIDEAMALATELVDTAVENISPRIRVAAWAEIAKMRPDFAVQHLGDLVATLHNIDQADSEAAYGLVAQVASKLAYVNPDATTLLFDKIKDGEPTFSSDKERLDWARAQVAAAKALFDKSNTVGGHRLLLGAQATYESMRIRRVSDFYTTQYAECLILLQEFGAAKQVLECLSVDKRNAYWWHRYAQAHVGLGNRPDALIAIDRALSALDNEKYRSAFLELRFDIRQASGDPDAATDLKKAISLADLPKYRESMERKLAAIESTR